MRQSTQPAAQVVERVRAQRLALAPQHDEAERAIERRHVRRLEPPGLAFLEAQAHDAFGAAEIDATERAYFPWIGALHSLLDNLVDAEEDRASGQHSLTACYASSDEAQLRMGMLARRSLEAARTLPRASEHVLILAAMASYYLSSPQARTPEAARRCRYGR